ncbi:unnamed protein product [Rhizophagus irregularis]|uniref:Uncharacterized protein n=1 Tax=Rhizophagus irregularis TaxID=588596 RepID=A0A915YQN3_9GLOM|nr:unnamed protein product [Rhizophagus irregularis]
MNELFSPSSYNINNINIPEEFGLLRELFFFNNPDNYMQMDPNMVAANEPFITTQRDHEDILLSGYKRHKGRVAHKRIKSSIEGNKRNIALPDKTNTIACALLESSHENRESKTLRRCKNCHGIGHCDG